MSIHTLTIDEFAMLTAAHHHLAVRLYSGEILLLIKRAAELPVGPEHNAVADELLQLMQLRKVHQVRLDELEGEESEVGQEAKGQLIPAAA